MSAPTAVRIREMLRTQAPSRRARREKDSRRAPKVADDQWTRAGSRTGCQPPNEEMRPTNGGLTQGSGRRAHRLIKEERNVDHCDFARDLQRR